MATIRDVAKRAGVSVPTVSRVLNNHPKVASDLVKRVRSAIKALDYRPSRAAQRLRTQESTLVGVVLSDISNPFYIQVLRGIEDVLSREGMNLLVGNADGDAIHEAELISLMRSEHVAGLVIAPTHEVSPTIKAAIDDRLPVTIIDRRMRDCDVDTVFADGKAGSHAAVSHLIALGHKRIGVISGPLHLSSAQDRYTGYLQAMSEAGLSVDANLTRFGDYRLESGHDLARELMNRRKPPTALFVANNQMTIGALNAIHEMDIRIPDEVAVVGFDDFDWAISLNPPLTTIAQSSYDIGVNAASLLLARIGDPDLPKRTVVLNTELKVRASCGAARKNKQVRGLSFEPN